MTIIKTVLPKNSLLNINHKKYDYTDSYRSILNDDENKFSPVDIVKSSFSSIPKWVGKLFTLRNRIVSIFGLKTSGKVADRQNQLKNFKCEKGDQFGLFKVFDKTENEIILGENDRHLNFRISILLEDQKKELNKKVLTISTTVEFNNWLGRLYFLPVKPFHKLIVSAILKGTVRELEKRNV